MCSFRRSGKSRPWIQHKLLAKFSETGSAERLDVHLVNGSSKLKPDSRVNEMTNNSRSLLDGPHIFLCCV